MRPQYRGRGSGTAFFRRIGAWRWIAARSARRAVLDWNEPALNFYRKIGAVPMSEWTVQRLVGDGLATLAGDL